MTEQTPPTDRPRPPAPHVTAPSVVIVNTGHGKGKTTAALGTAMRAAARGWKVCVVQFLKSAKWKVGEEKSGLDLGFEWWSIGDGFTWDSKDMDETEAIARAAWVTASEKIASGDYELVVLDEITYPINWEWIDGDEVARAIRERPKHVNVVATGRDAPDALLAVADTVTEMVNVRHAYDNGVRAIRGIDF